MTKSGSALDAVMVIVDSRRNSGSHVDKNVQPMVDEAFLKYMEGILEGRERHGTIAESDDDEDVARESSDSTAKKLRLFAERHTKLRARRTFLYEVRSIICLISKLKDRLDGNPILALCGQLFDLLDGDGDGLVSNSHVIRYGTSCGIPEGAATELFLEAILEDYPDKVDGSDVSAIQRSQFLRVMHHFQNRIDYAVTLEVETEVKNIWIAIDVNRLGSSPLSIAHMHLMMAQNADRLDGLAGVDAAEIWNALSSRASAGRVGFVDLVDILYSRCARDRARSSASRFGLSHRPKALRKDVIDTCRCVLEYF